MENAITRFTIDRVVPVLTGSGAGSVWARCYLGAIVVIPPLLCGVCVLGGKAGWVEFWSAAVFMAIGNMLLLTLVIWRTALLLNRVEESRRRSESELQRLRKEAEEVSATSSRSFATMSEELCTPLNSIIGFSEILADETFGELNARQQKYVDNVLGSGRHLLRLINNIVDLSQIDAGVTKLEWASIEVEAVLAGVETMFSGLAGREGITLSTAVDPNVPAVFADPGRFKQILGHLVSNAIKFSSRGGVVSVQATLWDGSGLKSGEPGSIPPRVASTLGMGKHLLLSVTDTGIGILPRDQNRLFKEFGQIESTYTQREEGTGLGLVLVKRLVELHGGAIWIESEGLPGRGSTFRFVIPLREETTKAGTQPNRWDYPLVLVIGGRDGARLLNQQLSDAGYAFAHALTGSQAIQMAIDYHPRAIALDILRTGTGGWDVLAELRTNPRTRGIPVVVMALLENGECGFSLGAVEYFLKPVDRDQLIAAVGKVAVRQSTVAKTILVVDDKTDVVEMVRSTVEEAGLKVVAATGSREALQKARANLPDLIVLNLAIPDGNGLKVAKQLRTDPLTKNIPILAHTNKALTEKEKRDLEVQVEGLVRQGGTVSFLEDLERLTRRSDFHRDKELV